MLDSENQTAYDCRTTMKTMYALVERGLIKRTNWKDVVRTGRERTEMKFRLTDIGKVLAEKGKTGEIK